MDVFLVSVLAASISAGTAILYACLGEILCERSGVLNLGVEGMMLMGAFWGLWGAEVTGSWVIGLLIGMVAGLLLALLHALFSVTLRADQIDSGFAMTFLAAGITGIGAWFNGRPFLTSAYGYVDLPGLEPFELATAMGFDLGVFLCVVGATMLALASLSRIARAAGGKVNIEAMDYRPPAPEAR